VTDLDKAIQRTEALLKAFPPGSLSCEGHVGKWRVMYDLKAQHPKHWDQDDEAFRNGGWKPLDLSTEDRARFIASAPELVRRMLDVVKDAKALVDCIDKFLEKSDSRFEVTIGAQKFEWNMTAELRQALTAFGERVGGGDP
jgi:hypothetical protein